MVRTDAALALDAKLLCAAAKLLAPGAAEAGRVDHLGRDAGAAGLAGLCVWIIGWED